MSEEIARTMESVATKAPAWVELRYHRRQSQSLQVQKGLVKQARALTTAGVGVRALFEGAWGFSSTSDFSLAGIEKACQRAIQCAKSISALKKSKIPKLPSTKLARGVFNLPGYQELFDMPMDEKLHHLLKAEKSTRDESSRIVSATSAYSELFEDKAVVTSDGARALSRLARAEFRLSAFAGDSGSMSEGHHNIGRTGAWDCLFSVEPIEKMTGATAKLAVDILDAPSVPGGEATLILCPAIVGLLAHEAIGHTVEADFVQSGSVAAGKIGQVVASPLVTLQDGGIVPGNRFGGGDLLVDDEGVPTQVTTVIKEGKLVSYLHNRESAAHFGVEPTGNARAWLYSDEPLIRMRNTYLCPGESSVEDIIASTSNGYLLEGAMGGQADATGEFMFGVQKITHIENGKRTKTYRGGTISGKAFDVLSSVDAVSREFQLDLGSGYCGKGQPAKVDAGGPYIRCKATLGGSQK